MNTTVVWWLKSAKGNSALYSDISKIRKYCMLILTLSLVLSLTLMQSMEILQRWPSHGVRFTNNSGWPLNTPCRVKLNSPWLVTFKICLIISHKIWKGNQKHRIDTTFSTPLKMRSIYSNTTQTFSIILWKTYYNYKIKCDRPYNWKFTYFIL